jgi:hypothetical protein
MGIVSGAVLEHGGHVTGVVPFAMVAAGGEGDKADGTTKTPAVAYLLNEKGREKVSCTPILYIFRYLTEVNRPKPCVCLLSYVKIYLTMAFAQIIDNREIDA